VPPRRKTEGAAPGKTGLLDRTKPDSGTSEETWEQLKAEFVADLAGPQEQAPDDVGANWLDLPEDKGGAAETRPARREARKRKTGSRSRGGAKPKALSRRPKRRTSRNGRLDLNAATFDELRSLGLSVTQSKRLIAYRDARGGYASLDELDEVPGLSKATRAELRSRLKLGP
jgi:DNA uptake protein ComE-like DNA-binding protein